MARDSKATIRKRIHKRIRAKLAGTTERPRLAVFRSLNHIYAQVIDDAKGVTLAAASTLDKDLKSKLKTGADIAAASAVGKLVAERAKKAGLTGKDNWLKYPRIHLFRRMERSFFKFLTPTCLLHSLGCVLEVSRNTALWHQR